MIEELPHNTDLEWQILGSAFDPIYGNEAHVIIEQCREIDFDSGRPGLVFRVLKDFVAKKKPQIKGDLINEFKKQLEETEPNYNFKDFDTNLVHNHSSNLSYHIQELKKLSYRRQIAIKLTNAISKIKTDEDIEEILEDIKDKISDFTVDKLSQFEDLIDPYTLEQLTNEIKRTPDGLSTGYNKLDEIVGIPQEAITIIAGRPSHGKTTFMMNLALNIVEQDPEKTVVFFSYEETRKQIGLKFLNILSKKEINTNRNIDALKTYIKLGKDSTSEIEAGKKLFKSITDNNNLKIIDISYHVDQLCLAIEFLKNNYNLSAVFIDYIQKIRARGNYGNRTVELEYISNQLLNTAKDLSIPIILGAQLGRDKEHKDKVQLDNLRSSGDIEQDANVVLGLYNSAMQKAIDDGAELKKSIVDLKVTVLKNRDGAVNEECKLKFNRPILDITEPESWSDSDE